MEIGRSHIRIDFSVDRVGLPIDSVVAAIKDAATSVAEYYGKFPVPKLRVHVEEKKNSDVIFGTENEGASIEFYLGDKAGEKQLKESWMLTHEMSHLAFPDLDPKYHWMEGGFRHLTLSRTMRARRGIISENRILAGYL